MFLLRTLAKAAALDFHETAPYLKTGDIVTSLFSNDDGLERAAIVVEGSENQFAWTTSARGTPHLIALEEFVAQNDNIVVIRRLSTEQPDLCVRMADYIEQVLTRSRVVSNGGTLVVDAYIRLHLARSCCKRLDLFDVEDLLLGGDLDAALEPHVSLSRDAYICRRHRR